MLENAILVTGAGRRIGYHIARRLHQDGYTVIAHYRTHTAEIKALSDLGVTTMEADFSNKMAILQFIEALQEYCGSFRALIHNASSFEATATNLTEAADQYEQFFHVHMMAPFLINPSKINQKNKRHQKRLNSLKSITSDAASIQAATTFILNKD